MTKDWSDDFAVFMIAYGYPPGRHTVAVFEALLMQARRSKAYLDGTYTKEMEAADLTMIANRKIYATYRYPTFFRVD